MADSRGAPEQHRSRRAQGRRRAMTRFAFLRIPAPAALLLILLFLGKAVAQQAMTPQTTVSLLRSLVIEGRVGLVNSASPTDPRLFTQKVADGRTVMEFIA